MTGGDVPVPKGKTSSLHCPHCKARGISLLRKAALGPALPARCSACDARIGVPMQTLYLAIPVFAGFVFLPLVDPYWLRMVLLFVLIAGFVTTWIRWVPLEAR